MRLWKLQRWGLKQVMSSAIKSERTDVRFEHHLLKSHVQQQAVSLGRGWKLYVGTDLISNLKKRAAEDGRSLSYWLFFAWS